MTNSKCVTDWTSEDVNNYLLQCTWASPEFVKEACLADLNGPALLCLTKKDLQAWGIQELGVIKAYLRAIRQLDPATQQESQRWAEEHFSCLEEKERLQTPRPAFGRPGSMDCTSPSGQALRSRTHSAFDRPLTASFASPEPPVVGTLEEYHAYRKQHGQSVSEVPKDISKGCPSYVGQTEESLQAATDQLRKLEESQEQFRIQLERKLEDAFGEVDKDEMGYIKPDQLDTLLKTAFKTFKPGMIKEYKALLLGQDWRHGDTSGRITAEDFKETMLKKLLGLEAAFRIVDKDGSGELEYIEIEQMIREILPNHAPKERRKFVRQIMDECDTGANGRVEIEEFVTSHYAHLLAGPAEMVIRKRKRLAKLEALFLSVDTLRVGVLSHSQMQTLIDQSLPDHSEREKAGFLEVIIQECDRDQSGSIEFAEFTESSYANLLLGEQPEEVHEDDLDQTLRRDSFKSQRSGTRQPSSASGLSVSNRGVVGETKEDALLDPAEKARLRRLEREAAEAAGKAPATKEREIALQRMQEREEEVDEIKRHISKLVMQQDSRLQQIGIHHGILETERRHSAVTELFYRWDEVMSSTDDGSELIEAEELRRVIQRCYNWTDAETEANFKHLMRGLDKDQSGALDLDEFHLFVRTFTSGITNRQFDLVIGYITDIINKLAAELEHDRRVSLLQSLFKHWDHDESGFLDNNEVFRVVTRYKDEERDGGEDDFVNLFFSSTDENKDGTLDKAEFVLFFDQLTQALEPMAFDSLIYQFSRCIEEVHLLLTENQASLTYKQTLLNSLEAYEVAELLDGSTPLTPLLLYGDTCDPSRAVENAARARKLPMKSHLVTNKRSERLALKSIEKHGLGGGQWVYVVIPKGFEASSGYRGRWSPIRFLRSIGVMLNTAHRPHPRFRIWCWAPFRDIRNFPHVLSTTARSEDLNEIDPEDTGLSTKEMKAKRTSQVRTPGLWKARDNKYGLL
mmetsp:Transcript_121299/g.210852  ORF Transcript_121299/g.210852 Transcript_121299/m.210852 type:complete len:968 (-) Transcript_121299:351-3254(-)